MKNYFAAGLAGATGAALAEAGAEVVEAGGTGAGVAVAEAGTAGATEEAAFVLAGAVTGLSNSCCTGEPFSIMAARWE